MPLLRAKRRNLADCVGFEAKGQRSDGQVVEAAAVVLNDVMQISRPAGSIGIPGA
jgi:spore germination cell wall hydrolase CwlJ-like protein